MSDSPAPQLTFLAPEPADLAPLFPGYELHGLIATGGMGAVYLAVQKSLERMVAIKILPQEFSTDAAFCAGFEAEAKAMARLNHPNLIGVYDFGEVNGMLFIIMEYVPGKSLFHSAHGLAIDPEEVIRLVIGICSGLAHAHANGIIHRDIKPSNILLDQNAQPKIGDFGLAHPVGRTVQDGEGIFGTPHYTAPEVVSAPRSVNFRADLFSVGVLLHELLTGRLPAEDPRPASVIMPCDPRFDAIIRRATDPLPERRYASAEEIANDLRAITQPTPHRGGAGAPSAGPPRAVPGRTRANANKKKSSSLPTILLLLLVIVIAAAAYQYFAPARAAKKSAPAAPAQAPATTPVPEAAPVPPPTPEPEAAPAPAPAPEPTVTPAAEPMSDAAPAAAPADDVAPVADVTEFLTRARKIMSERAAPVIAKYRGGIKDTFAAYQRAILRGSDRALTPEEIAQANEHFQKDQGRIPTVLEYSFTVMPEVSTIHTLARDKQTSLDETFQQELARLAPNYILGLEKQVERLKADHDLGAARLIQEEIDKSRYDPQYFPKLMLGSDLPADAPVQP
ncbi:MAG: serine/threonine-protein kinase [Verrucomicrobiota bacterium]